MLRCHNGCNERGLEPVLEQIAGEDRPVDIDRRVVLGAARPFGLAHETGYVLCGHVDMWFGGRFGGFGGFGGRTRQRVDIPLGDSQTVTLTLASSTLAQANFSPPGGDDTLC